MTATGAGRVTEASAKPATWPYRTVVAAAHVLPSGDLRDRYRSEFVAELYGMPRRQQTMHALQVLSRAWALRIAVTSKTPPSAPEAQMTTTKHVPLVCRLNLHHWWQTHSNDDGGRYRQCARCGKDKSGSANGPGDWAAGASTSGVGGA